MAYSAAILARAKARLAAAREQNAQDDAARIGAIYERLPRLRQIDLELQKTAAKVCAAAFRAGEDIHARTAAEVYGVPLEAVTQQMRSACKAVNFGIVYGISDFALAKNIGVTRAEARGFIDRYFERYSGVRAYMDAAVQSAREKGYAETLMGRRRYLPEINSGNFNVRSFGERCAMNSPIQGTAADIIKLAMIRVFEALRAQKLPDPAGAR